MATYLVLFIGMGVGAAAIACAIQLALGPKYLLSNGLQHVSTLSDFTTNIVDGSIIGLVYGVVRIWADRTRIPSYDKSLAFLGSSVVVGLVWTFVYVALPDNFHILGWPVSLQDRWEPGESFRFNFLANWSESNGYFLCLGCFAEIMVLFRQRTANTNRTDYRAKIHNGGAQLARYISLGAAYGYVVGLATNVVPERWGGPTSFWSQTQPLVCMMWGLICGVIYFCIRLIAGARTTLSKNDAVFIMLAGNISAFLWALLSLTLPFWSYTPARSVAWGSYIEYSSFAWPLIYTDYVEMIGPLTAIACLTDGFVKMNKIKSRFSMCETS